MEYRIQDELLLLENPGVLHLSKLLCSKFVENSGAVHEHAEALKKRFLVIVNEFLLSKREYVSTTDSYSVSDDEITSAVLWHIRTKHIGSKFWMEKIYNQATRSLNRLDTLRDSHVCLPSILRMLLIISTNRDKDIIPNNEPKLFDLDAIIKYKIDSFVALTQLPQADPLIGVLGRLKRLTSYSRTFTRSLSWNESSRFTLALPATHRYPRERNDSISIVDEGFVTPGDEIENNTPGRLDSYDWKALISLDVNHHKTWETIGCSKVPVDCSLSNMFYLFKNKLTSSHTKCIYFTKHDLMRNIKGLLLGLPSSCFNKIDQDFEVIDGVYTDGSTFESLRQLCQPFIEGGKNYLILEKLIKCEDCPFQRALRPALMTYLSKYHAMINAFDSDEDIIELSRYVAPIMAQFKYLVKYLNPLPVGSDLVKRLYNCMMEVTNRSIFFTIIHFFISVCEVYLSLISQWVFSGHCNPSLFVNQNIPMKEVKDRATWLKMFSYSMDNEPSFLPAEQIFECGRNVVLLTLCCKDKIFISKVLRKPSERLQMVLCRDADSVAMMEDHCRQYYKKYIDFFPPVSLIFQDSVPLVKEDLDQAKSKSLQRIQDYSAKQIGIESLQKRQEFERRKEDMNRARAYKMMEFEEKLMHEKMIEKQAALLESESLHRIDESRKLLLARLENETAKLHKRILLNSWRKKIALNTEKRMKYFAELQEKGEEYYELGLDWRLPKDAVDFSRNMTEVMVIPGELDNIYRSRTALKKFDTPSVDNSNIVENVEKKTTNRETKKVNLKKVIEKSAGKVLYEPELRSCGEDSNSADSSEHQTDLAIKTESDSDMILENPNCDIDCDDCLYSLKSIIEADDTVMPDCPVNIFLPDMKHNFFSKKKVNKSSADKSHDNYNRIVFDEYLKKSVLSPLRTQTKLLNQALLRIIFEDCNFSNHMFKLRSYFFLSDSLYGLKLTDLLSKAVEVEKPEELLTFTRLEQILYSASSVDFKYLSFAVNEVPLAFNHTDPEVLSCLRLHYLVEWPLNLIITDKVIVMYNRVFDLLMAIERTLWHLKQLYYDLKIRSTDTSQQIIKIQLQRHVMFHFVNSLKFYFVTVAFNEDWNDLLVELQQTDNLEGLYRAHVSYLKQVNFRCLLNQKAATVNRQIMKLLHYILVYCRTVKFGEWTTNSNGECINAKFAKINHSFSSFVVIGKYLINYMQRLSEAKGHKQMDVYLPSLSMIGQPNET